MDYKDENGREYYNMKDMAQVQEFKEYAEQLEREKQAPKKKVRVYPWTGMTFGEFILGALKVIVFSPVFILLFFINLIKSLFSLFITWILGKFAILFGTLLLGGLLSIPFPILETPVINTTNWMAETFFNWDLAHNSTEGMTLFPGEMVEVTIIIVLAILVAFTQTVDPE